jgi:hypothetical protein
MKKFTIYMGAMLVAALMAGCATPLGTVMEAPVDDMDVAEIAANLPDGKAMMYSHRYQSMQPNSTTKVGNDSSLTVEAAKDLVKFGNALGAADSTAKALADIGNKDRLIESTLVIADSPDIRAMRISDNKAAMIQNAKVVDVINNVTLVQDMDDDVQITITNPAEPASSNTPPVEPKPPGVVEPDPNASLDAISISGAKLLGPHKNVDPAKARITDVLANVTLSENGMTLDYVARDWPDNDSGIGGNIDGRVYMYWMDGDGLVGGHFDWKRPDAKSRDFKNIRTGYLDGRKPPVGSDVYIVLVTNKGDRRTNVIKADGVWQ